MKKIILLVPVLICFLSCDIREGRYITINNYSNDSIICFTSKVDIKHLTDVTEMDLSIDINKNDFGGINPITETWEEYIEKCDAKKIRIYILANDSLKKYDWTNVYKKSIYNEKYELTIEDLEAENWAINYK